MAAGNKRVKLPVRTGDVVSAITGEDSMGNKTGKVLKVFASSQTAVVEGFNLVKRHVRKTQDNPQGGIVEKEAPIAMSNLAVQTQAEGSGKKAKKAGS